MKTGNSLIGGNVKEVEDALSRDLFGSQFAGLLSATQLMRRVGALSDVTAAQVAESKQAYSGASGALAPFKRVLDVWISEAFGNKGAHRTASLYAGSIVAGNYSKTNAVDKTAIERARALADSKRFFHWELEFPEVFFDQTTRKANPGFDAVVGNPPYFAINTHLSPQETNYFKFAYLSIYTGNSDILYYFLSLSSQILRDDCKQGMIVSRYFQDAKYAAPLRSFLTQTTNIELIVDFRNFQVFGEEVNVLTIILILQKAAGTKSKSIRVLRLVDDNVEEQQVALALPVHDLLLFENFESTNISGSRTWNFQNVASTRFSTTFRQNTVPLSSIASVVQSMQTGLNEVLAPSLNTLLEYAIESELIHPIAKSGSILRYEFEQLDHAMIWTYGITLDQYPHTKAYLSQFQDALAARYDIRSRKANWWDISNPRSAELFLSERPRLLVPFIATGNKFSVDNEKRLNDGGDIRGIFLKPDTLYSPHYLSAILNSKAGEYYHLHNTKLKRGGYYEYFEGQLSVFPIRRISFTTSADVRAAAVAAN